MTPRQQLVAYLATLAALVVVVLGSLTIAALHPELIGKVEAFGLGAVTGGLIGVLRMPAVRNVTIDNGPADPVPVDPK